MAPGAVGNLSAGEHACDLFDAAAAVEFVDAHRGAAAEDFLLYEQVAVGKSGDLRLPDRISFDWI